MNKVERCAAYVRVSSEEQRLHGLSLDAQKMKLIEYADKHDLTICAWYVDEGVSGRKLIRNRPQLQRMIQDAENRQFDRILFIKLDRFFRSVAEYHECMKRISPVVWTATEESYDLTTANGRMFVNMKLTIAELEADQTGERIRIVNDYKVKAGTPLTGRMSFAFTIKNDENGVKRIMRNPETEKMVYDLISHFLQHQTKYKTAQYIRDKYHFDLSVRMLKTLLSSPFLCGEYRGNPNFCQGYVDKETFDRIQDILSRNIKNNTRQRYYIFTGLIRCPECGRRLAGMTTSQKNKRGDGYFRYKKYHCVRHTGDRRCGFLKMVSENVLERMMIDFVEPAFNQLVAESDHVSDQSFCADETIRELTAEINRLNYSWQKGRITPEEYDSKYDALMEQLIQTKEKNENQPDFQHIADVLHEGWKGVYDGLDDFHKRSFWRSIIRQIDIEWTTDIKRIKRILFF